MEVTNLRREIDPVTYEPFSIVDVRVSDQHLYNIATDDVPDQQAFIYMLGKELFDSIRKLKNETPVLLP